MNLMLLLMVFVFTRKLQATNTECENNPEENSSNKLLDYLIEGPLAGKAWDWLAPICDDFGSRMVGSKGLEKAIDHIKQSVIEDGFDNVHTEEVTNIPKFERGNDKVKVIEPRKRSLKVLAIPGTKSGTVEAEVVVLTTEDEFKTADITGKIVLFVPKWAGYSLTVRARYTGFMVKAKGGVGLLVKSITPFSLGTLHTGRGGYGKFEIPVPAASITVEDAEMLLRWHNRGQAIKIKMRIQSRTSPTPATSKNLIFDIKGKQQPNSIIVLGAHTDTWDVGQGAMDDGGGFAALYFAMKAIKELSETDCSFVPKRTIRALFFTGEEQGFYGGEQYFAEHWNKTDEEFFFVSETDNGAFKPTNSNSTLNFKGSEAQKSDLQKIVQKLNDYGIPLTLRNLNYQGDVQKFADKGVPSVGYGPDKGRDWYFNFQHSDADYMNAITKEDIDYTAGIFAVLAHNLANFDGWSST